MFARKTFFGCRLWMFLALPFILSLSGSYLFAQQPQNPGKVNESRLQKQIVEQQRQLTKIDSLQQLQQRRFDQAIKMAETDLQHSTDLLQVSENLIAFVGFVLALFGIVLTALSIWGIREIRRLSSLRQQLSEQLEEARKSQKKAHRELEQFKKSSAREGKELLQILFCLSEGDRDQEANKLDEAINWYKQALQIRNDDPEVYAKLGYVYSRIGEYGYAIKYLEDGYAIDPVNTTILNSLARAYRKSGQYQEAEKYYHEALAIDDEFFWALSGLSTVKTHTGEFREAEKLLHHCLLKEDSYHSHVNMGIVYLGLEQEEKAEIHFRKALGIIESRLQRTRENNWLYARKVTALIGLGEYKQAESILRKMMSKGVYAEVVRSLQERLTFFKRLREPSKIEPFEKILSNNNHS